MKELNIEKLKDRSPNNLSGGEKKEGSNSNSIINGTFNNII